MLLVILRLGAAAVSVLWLLALVVAAWTWTRTLWLLLVRVAVVVAADGGRWTTNAVGVVGVVGCWGTVALAGGRRGVLILGDGAGVGVHRGWVGGRVALRGVVLRLFVNSRRGGEEGMRSSSGRGAYEFLGGHFLFAVAVAAVGWVFFSSSQVGRWR